MLSSFLREVRALLETIDESMAQEFVSLLDRAAAMTPLTDPAPCPVPDLARARDLATPATCPAIDALLASAGELRWSRPDPAVVPPGWAHRSATTEIIGSEGAIAPATNERFGIFLLDTGCDYPDHWHDAEEFYLVLAGSGDWTIGDTTRTLTAGDYSRTPSRAHHAIITRDRPVFTVWGWSGDDTTFDSYRF
ncbi:MAG: dimethylsulfonioproprionate lyase family protein [Acidimicrobiales bacterium]